ncbi:MAG: DUF1232 domain-containing protein [Planctomycetes bacterium]|nr:DUF1232 domain-containing protein [Planctomycetota bacterium]
MPNQDDYASQYDEKSFLDHGRAFAKSAGRGVIEKALWLYYAIQEPGVPPWAKASIIGALGYFICPLDAIPDLAPFIGFADDLGVLAMAVATVGMHITAEVRKKAAARMSSWGLIDDGADPTKPTDPR